MRFRVLPTQQNFYFVALVFGGHLPSLTWYVDAYSFPAVVPNIKGFRDVAPLYIVSKEIARVWKNELGVFDFFGFAS